MLLDESYFETFPKEIRYNKYVLVDSTKLTGENYLGTYDSEIEAYKMYKKVTSKNKRIFRANVTFIEIENMKFMKSYEEIKENE